MQNILNSQVKRSLQDLSTGAPACGPALPGYSSCAVRTAHFHNLNGEPEAVGTLSELSQLWQPVVLSPSHVLWSWWLCPQVHHSFLVLSTSTWDEKLVAALWAISCFLMKSIGLLGGKKTLTRPTLNEVICFHGVTGALYFPSSLKKLTTVRYIQRSRDEIYLVRVNQLQWKKNTCLSLVTHIYIFPDYLHFIPCFERFSWVHRHWWTDACEALPCCQLAPWLVWTAAALWNQTKA